MCGGVQFTHAGQTYKIYFPNPEAVLPVLLKDGSHQLLPWGRREGQDGQLPRGGWARHDSIVNGVWDPYFPKAVKLDLQAFMEKDAHGKSHWYPLLNGWVQGLVARAGKEERVYVVTITPTLPDQRAIHDRWPRIVMGGQHPRMELSLKGGQPLRFPHEYLLRINWLKSSFRKNGVCMAAN